MEIVSLSGILFDDDDDDDERDALPWPCSPIFVAPLVPQFDDGGICVRVEMAGPRWWDSWGEMDGGV